MITESPSRPSGIADSAVIRAAGLDDWSAVRPLHAAAFERLTGPYLEAGVVAAMRAYMATPEYTEDLIGQNIALALVDGFPVGTCGWVPSDDTGYTARIVSLFVDPMFTRLGIGRRLVEDAEARAQAAGFRALSTRATDSAVEFFLALGYEIAAQGVTTRAVDLVLPVTFLRKRDRAGDQTLAEVPEPSTRPLILTEPEP